MRRLFGVLPGPAPVRVLLMIILFAVGLVALGFLFDAAGDLLDNGGTIG